LPTRATRRKNHKGSNRLWMKVQWQVTAPTISSALMLKRRYERHQE
jgi:hypothetical protein